MRRHAVMPTLGALMAGVNLSACGDVSEPATSQVVVYDSAGIEIVENPDDPALKAPVLHVDPEPALRIGTADGPEVYQLFGVRGAVRLSDGRVAVLNWGTQQVRYYDADGSHLETVGGRGGGPGEFEGAGVMRRIPGDTLLVWDFARQALSWFSPEGRFVRSQTAARDTWTGLFGSDYVTDVLTVLPDGSLLLRVRSAQSQGSLGWDRPPLGLARTTPEDLAQVDSLGWYRGLEHYNVGTESRPLLRSVPYFARATHVAAGGDPMRIYVAAMEEPMDEPGSGYEIHAFRPDGSKERTIRHLQPARGIRGDEVDQARQLERALAESRPVPQESIDEQVRSLPVPNVAPPHADIMADITGTLWVQQWHPVMSERRHYTVFAPDGHLSGEVEIPENFQLMDIGPDYILGVWQDPSGVEFIHLYTLREAG